MAYFKHGAFAQDPWQASAGPQRAIMSTAEWLERGDDPLPSCLGLRLEAGFAVESLADDIGRFDLITVAFPKFTDGRGYSMGWLLRSRLGYKKELRATGDVLFDEMQFMIRCGFDAFEITDENTLRLLGEGRRAAALNRFYQPGLESEVPQGTRPWARASA